MIRTNNFLKRIWSFWWVALLIILAPCMIKSLVPNTDTFFLMSTGRYIVENGSVPTINPFVIHEGFEIIVQQWLFDVIMYVTYNALGNLGLFLFILFTYTISMVLLYKYISLFSKNTQAKGFVMLISGLLYVLYGVARPTCISFIVMLALLYSVEQHRRTNKVGYLIALPFLSLLEVNIHSAMWPMMFVLLLPYIFPVFMFERENLKKCIKRWFTRNKFILLTIPIMLAVGFLNPNGLKGMTYLLSSYNSATTGLSIAELEAPTVASEVGAIITIIIAALTIWIYQNKDKLKDKTYDIQNEFTMFSMTCGVLILACTHLRNGWYLILGATPLLLNAIGDYKWKIKKPKWLNQRTQIALTVIGLVSTILLSYLTVSIASYSDLTTIDSEYAPMAAADYLDENKTEDIKLFTEFNNGAYMEWRGYKVYIDARPEIFEEKINGKENIYTEYCKLSAGTIDYEEFLNKYNFTHLIAIDNQPFSIYLSLQEDYTPVVIGNGYTMYERNQNQGNQ